MGYRVLNVTETLKTHLLKYDQCICILGCILVNIPFRFGFLPGCIIFFIYILNDHLLVLYFIYHPKMFFTMLYDGIPKEG